MPDVSTSTLARPWWRWVHTNRAKPTPCSISSPHQSLSVQFRIELGNQLRSKRDFSPQEAKKNIRRRNGLYAKTIDSQKPLVRQRSRSCQQRIVDGGLIAMGLLLAKLKAALQNSRGERSGRTARILMLGLDAAGKAHTACQSSRSNSSTCSVEVLRSNEYGGLSNTQPKSQNLLPLEMITTITETEFLWLKDIFVFIPPQSIIANINMITNILFTQSFICFASWKSKMKHPHHTLMFNSTDLRRGRCLVLHFLGFLRANKNGRREWVFTW